MHNLKLWSPSNNNNNLNSFKDTLNNNLNFKSYVELHKWSVENKNIFWKEIWKFTKIIGNLKGNIYSTKDDFIKSEFFPESELNYSENCLSKNDDSDAIIFYSENIQ